MGETGLTSGYISGSRIKPVESTARQTQTIGAAHRYSHSPVTTRAAGVALKPIPALCRTATRPGEQQARELFLKFRSRSTGTLCDYSSVPCVDAAFSGCSVTDANQRIARGTLLQF